jgi:hypothetical protein
MKRSKLNLRRGDAPIDSQDPFKGDLFDRKPLAERLVNFLRKTEGPFTMALTGPYGSGKTYFLLRCKLLLEQSGVHSVLINAWETDFSSEPLAPIISELSQRFSDQLKPEDRRWDKAKSLAGKVAAASIPIGVKLFTAGILEAQDFTGSSAIADVAQKMAEKQFEQFAAAKKSIDGLKKELTRLTTKIRERDLKSEKSEEDAQHDPPVVVIIDELDRCRPAYAIELLEVLKHFFDVPGIIFILGIDREQLVSAAKAVFGTGLDADGYLRRFIDLECSLPQPSIHTFCINVARSEQSILNWQNYEPLLESIARLCEGAKFSLRKTHQFVIRASIAVIAASRTTGDGVEITLLVFVREYDPQLYEAFVTKKINAWALLMKLRELDPEFGYPNYQGGVPFINFLAAVGNDDTPKPFIDLLEEDYRSNNVQHAIGFLRNNIQGSWKRYLAQLVPFVDFCATFAAD